MTQEDKELLFKDLCARLPYKVKVQHIKNYKDNSKIVIKSLNYSLLSIVDSQFKHEELKPYLFPLSSMTEEEVDEFTQFDVYGNGEYMIPNHEAIDWLNKHHFDYRGLIPMGLAIDATNLSIY